MNAEHEKSFHFHNVSRIQPADQMIKALCRLDQTPAFVSDVIRERIHQERNPKHLTTTFQQSNYPTGKSETRGFSYYQQDADESDDQPTGSMSIAAEMEQRLMEEDLGDAEFEADVSDWSWDPAEVDDDGTLLQDPNERVLLPDPERDVSEDEALEIINFATSYRNTRKGLRNAQTGRNFFGQERRWDEEGAKGQY